MNKINKYKNEEELMKDEINLLGKAKETYVIHPDMVWNEAVKAGIASQSAYRYYFTEIMRSYGALQMSRYMKYYEKCTKHLVKPLSTKDWDKKYCPTDHRLTWKKDKNGKMIPQNTDNFWYPIHKLAYEMQQNKLKNKEK
jgi:hypothetical protein